MKCVFHVKHNLQKKKSGGRQRAEERDRQRQTERQRERDRETGRETGGKKLEAPHSLKSNEAAQVQFEPQHPLVVDSFKNCEGLSRIAFLDGNTAVMLGKVTKVVTKDF